MFKAMKSRAFRRAATPILIAGIFLQYLYSCLMTDHINALQPYYAALYGWESTKITAPISYAALAVILFTLIVGTLFIKFGVTKVLIPSTLLCGLATVGLSFAGDNYVVYFICLFLMRLLTLVFQMGNMQLCTNWFLELRGRALGFSTIGNPLCTATAITLLTLGTQSGLGMKTYTIMGVITIGLGLFIGFLVKDTPETVGLNPDGAEVPCKSTHQDAGTITLKEVFSQSNAWLLMVAFGLLNFCIVSIMAFFVPHMASTGTADSVYLPALSVAALLGIPISYVLGWIDDKFGTVKACMLLCVTFIASLAALYFMHANSVALIAVAAFGIAGITGGTPNLHPSMTAYVFGRKNYQAANRYIMTIQAAFQAFATMFMSKVADITGSFRMGYAIMIVLVLVAAGCLILIGRTPDYDRGQK